MGNDGVGSSNKDAERMERKIDDVLAAKAEMYRRGMTRAEMEARLAGIFGGRDRLVLREGTDDEAYLNRKRMGKMIHSAQGSIDRGFTAKQHYAVMSDIVDLYEQSLKLIERGDRNGHGDVFIQRRGVPLHFGNAIAYITVKESVEGGKRVHNIVLAEIKKLEGMLAAEGIPNEPPSTSSFNDDAPQLAGDEIGYNPATSQPMRLYEDNINELISESKKKITENKNNFSSPENNAKTDTIRPARRRGNAPGAPPQSTYLSPLTASASGCRWSCRCGR